MVDARSHLNFCIEMYKVQHETGRHLLHEHPTLATSWEEQGMIVLANPEGVIRIRAHMCRFGMTQQTFEGPTFVEKSTMILTSSQRLARRLNRECIGDHQHIAPDGKNRTVQAQMHPEELCRVVRRRINEQNVMNLRHMFQISTVDHVDMDEEDGTTQRSEEFHESEPWEEAWDDVSGKALTPESYVRQDRGK